MIITRAPLRITLGGGGTDLPSYYEQFGGFVLSAAISKYIFISVNRTFTPDYFLKYSALERVERVEQIEHPIIREVLLAHDIGPSVELVSMADIPSGTGLGSSGAFTVGLLHAVYAFLRDHVTAGDLADEACAIEIDRLCRAVGRQDQYVAAFGGVKCFDFKPDGQVAVSPLAMSTDTLHDLEEHLLMFFTGYSRDADMVLVEQKARSQGGDTQMIDNLHYVKELGLRSRAALEQGDTQGFARSCTSTGSTRRSGRRRFPTAALTAGTNSAATVARLAASWSAPGRVASCSSTLVTSAHSARRWRPRASPKCVSPSITTAAPFSLATSHLPFHDRQMLSIAPEPYADIELRGQRRLAEYAVGLSAASIARLH